MIKKSRQTKEKLGDQKVHPDILTRLTPHKHQNIYIPVNYYRETNTYQSTLAIIYMG